MHRSSRKHRISSRACRFLRRTRPNARETLMAKWKKVAPEEKQKLAERLRVALAGRKGVTEKRMFGGTCFLLGNNMLCGTGSGNFLFRVGKEAHGAAVKRR